MYKFHLFCVGFHVDIVHSVVADSFARNVRRQTSLMQVGCDIDTGNDSGDKTLQALWEVRKLLVRLPMVVCLIWIPTRAFSPGGFV